MDAVWNDVAELEEFEGGFVETTAMSRPTASQAAMTSSRGDRWEVAKAVETTLVADEAAGAGLVGEVSRAEACLAGLWSGEVSVLSGRDVEEVDVICV